MKQAIASRPSGQFGRVLLDYDEARPAYVPWELVMSAPPLQNTGFVFARWSPKRVPLRQAGSVSDPLSLDDHWRACGVR